MSVHKPFDVSSKRLLELDPMAWLKLAGLQGKAVEILNSDLSSLIADADRVFRVTGAKRPYLANMEVQGSHEAGGDTRVLLYGVALLRKYDLPVESVVFLLRPDAEGGFTGRVGYRTPGTRLHFSYKRVRVWQLPVAELLAGSLATVPLAPIADITEEQLPGVIRHIESRFDAVVDAGERAELWTATYLLMGVRYRRDAIHALLKGVRELKESDTYQAILDEGREEEARHIVLRLGSKRFGLPDMQTKVAVEAITELEVLERLAERLMEVESWQELLA